MRSSGRVTVVIATMDRAGELDGTLDRLEGLDEVAAVVVVDNASGDDTVARVRAGHPAVEVLALPRNMGAAARNLGARVATTPYVAFADDDSWWEPGALAAAVAVLDADAGAALATAEVRVDPGGEVDPVSAAQAGGAYDRHWRRRAGGRRAVAGFLACAVVVDRARFLAVDGFSEALGIGGEEERTALDLASAGWGLVYAPEAVVRHRPSPSRDPSRRAATLARNDLVTALLRHPVTTLARRCAGVTPPALAAAARLVPWALAERREAPARIRRVFATI